MRRLLPVFVLVGVWLTVAADPPPLVYAQTAASKLLVIDGGTLIDGTGSAPVRDVQIVIEGDRIRGVGRKGQAPPSGAQVINADGKFIVPGLGDAGDRIFNTIDAD